MAQIASQLATNALGQSMITPEELREIQEYEKIVKLRDAIFAGTHPTIKLPHPVVKSNATRNVSSPSLPTHRAETSAPSSSSLLQHADASPQHIDKSPNNNRTVSGGHGQIASRSEINPILLEKSEDLIKAELQLQRQRLERTLRDQVESHRVMVKSMLQTSDALPDFDLADVLSKALAIVHPSTSAVVDPSVDASASDSFDDNTFYSSQHDTPEPSSPMPNQQKSVAEEHRHHLVSPEEKLTEGYAARIQARDQDVEMSGTSPSKGNNFAVNKHLQESQLQQSNSGSPSTNQGNVLPQADYIDGSSSGESYNARSKKTAAEEVATATRQTLQQRFEDDVASPLVRAHNLSPIAPQPARVSPLVTARDPPILRENHHADEVTPPQVVALRQDMPGISSSNSSPKRPTRAEAKKAKKDKHRKRKSSVSNEIGDRPASPYIKPEPTSPSPYAVAPLPRPAKRLRQYAPELNYDEPADVVRERGTERQRAVTSTQIYEDRYTPEHQRPRAVYRRVEPEDSNYQRIQYVSDDQTRRVLRRPQSPLVHALPYVQSEVRSTRAVSHSVADGRVYDEPVYYREPPIRGSVRPDADRERSRSPVMHDRRSPISMGPPQRPVRIVIDEHGRRYIDPTPPAVRQSLAPVRYRDQDIVYERPPPRSVSGRAPVDTYEEDGILYRRQSPPLAIPRRLVSQPEYSSRPEYRAYREREYSARPMAPPGQEYIQIRGAPERHQVGHFEDGPREYIPREASVRPESFRYELPREHGVRLQSVHPDSATREYAPVVLPETRREILPQSQREYSVRPEAPLREYVPNLHSEGRREVLSQPQREYSVRPEPAPREYVPTARSDSRREMVAYPQREYSVRPGEHPAPREQILEGHRYYEEAPIRRPAEVTYLERPRAREGSVMVYAEEPRREVYR